LAPQNTSITRISLPWKLAVDAISQDAIKEMGLGRPYPEGAKPEPYTRRLVRSRYQTNC
jgi:hypothetical protein